MVPVFVIVSGCIVPVFVIVGSCTVPVFVFFICMVRLCVMSLMELESSHFFWNANHLRLMMMSIFSRMRHMVWFLHMHRVVVVPLIVWLIYPLQELCHNHIVTVRCLYNSAIFITTVTDNNVVLFLIEELDHVAFIRINLIWAQLLFR